MARDKEYESIAPMDYYRALQTAYCELERYGDTDNMWDVIARDSNVDLALVVKYRLAKMGFLKNVDHKKILDDLLKNVSCAIRKFVIKHKQKNNKRLIL